MPHLETERLHRYLAGALEPAERQAVEAHLADCAACSMALAELAAEDAILTDALAFDAADRAWLESVDLVEPVMAQVAPRFRLTPPVIITSLLILTAGYMAEAVWSLGSALLAHRTNFGTVAGNLHRLVPDLLDLLAWLGRGGLLNTMWPLLAMGALYGVWRLTRTKETNDYA